MSVKIFVLTAAALVFGPPAVAAAASAATAAPLFANVDRPGGKMLFDRYCGACHDAGPGHPGTMMLGIQGRPHPALVGRTDIDADYIRQIVRGGLIEMPPFRPTDLTDAELDQVVAHILGSAKPALKGTKATPAKTARAK